jgi:hypothetical protein
VTKRYYNDGIYGDFLRLEIVDNGKTQFIEIPEWVYKDLINKKIKVLELEIDNVKSLFNSRLRDRRQSLVNRIRKLFKLKPLLNNKQDTDSYIWFLDRISYLIERYCKR